jgi:hypothetical protein
MQVCYKEKTKNGHQPKLNKQVDSESEVKNQIYAAQ